MMNGKEVKRRVVQFLKTATLGGTSAAMLVAAGPPVGEPPSTFYQHHGKVVQGLEWIEDYCKAAATGNGKFGMEIADRVGVTLGDLYAVSDGNGKGHIYPNLASRVERIDDNTWKLKTNNSSVREVEVRFVLPLTKATHTRVFVRGVCV